jgi:hypothetical protein
MKKNKDYMENTNLIHGTNSDYLKKEKIVFVKQIMTTDGTKIGLWTKARLQKEQKLGLQKIKT